MAGALVEEPRRWLRRVRSTRRLGLRARITLAFGVGALLLSALLSGTTWALTRENLINQREQSATALVYVNADRVRRNVQPDTTGEAAALVLSNLATAAGSRPILLLEGRAQPVALSGEFSLDALPVPLVDAVRNGQPARMQHRLRGEMRLAIGVPIPASEAYYFETVSMDDLESTLRALAVSLTGASLVTTLAGGTLGWWASRRALRPLSGVSTAAQALAGGRLDTRLEASADPDLAPIARSFNDMARSLQERIERDARFASDVSHELRSPLMTLSASIEVLQNQRDELTERGRSALDLMSADVERFQQLVEDLLEISRFDAGVVRLEQEEVHLAELVMQAVQMSSDVDVPVELDADLAGVIVEVDKRRIVRVIANLLSNATKYAGGATAVTLRRAPDEGRVLIGVEDRGPGVTPEDRQLVFERFSRGASAGRRGSTDGVGLGLSLVAEHVRLHGGRVWAEDRAEGEPGARFVVELPIAEETR